jgi:C4-dicarboxylate-binding protein DctP
MKIGHSQPITHPRHQSLLKFKEIVEAKTDKAVEVHIYAAGQLGSEPEQMEMVKRGTLQAARGGQFEAAPELLIYTMPFLFNDIESAHIITRGKIGERIAASAQKSNITIIATGDAGGLRNITNNVRAITKPEDMQGLKLRTPPVESIIKTMTAFGASPILIPYNDVYMCLKAGEADGQENPLVNIAALRLDEVQRYLTIVNYQYHPDPFYVNNEWYLSLEPEIRNVIKEAAVAMMIFNDELVERETRNSFDHLEKSMNINILTASQRQSFIEQAKPIYDDYISKGYISEKDLEEIRAAVK